MSETPETPVDLPADAPSAAWPPLRLGLYAVLIIMLLILAFLVSRDSATRRGQPPMPEDAIFISPDA